MTNHPNRSLVVPTLPLLAYHGKKCIKTNILKQLAKHRKADEIVKGQYWQDGKGCAVGCTLYSGDHAEYEPRFGIPQMLARLEDAIFEGLPNATAKLWPERFMDAIIPGTDLSRVGWQFLRWLLTDETINPGINHPLVRDAVKRCADVLIPLTKGLPVDVSAARSAERSAHSAARSAASAAARSAAYSAAYAASAAADAAAYSATWKKMAMKLIALIELAAS